MSVARGAKDSEAIMQQVIENNPQYQQAYSQMKQEGGTLKELFMNRAKSLGVNPDDVLNMLK